MFNPESRAALKRVLATLLSMGQTRLELAGLELARARKAALQTALLVLLAGLAFSFFSLMVCVLAIALAWDTPYRFAVIASCALAYAVLGLYFIFRLKAELAAQPELFEATVGELGRDRQAVLDSLSPVKSEGQNP